MIKAIIFDFDGVIHDTFEIAYKLDRQLIPDLTRDDCRDLFMGNLFEDKRITPEFLEKFHELQENVYKGLRIEEKIKNHLLDLKKKFRLFIVTSNKEAALKHYFDNNQLHNFFEDILGLETHKSKKEKFRVLLDRYRLNKGECIFVTDTLGDLIEANHFGLKAIAVDFGFHSKQILEKGRPLAIISDLSEIESQIKKIY